MDLVAVDLDLHGHVNLVRCAEEGEEAVDLEGGVAGGVEGSGEAGGGEGDGFVFGGLELVFGHAVVADGVANALDYNGLQIQGQHRLKHGLQFGLAYTFSHAAGLTGYDQYTEAGLVPGTNLYNRYYGPVATDRKHVLAANYTYNLPIPRASGIP